MIRYLFAAVLTLIGGSLMAGPDWAGELEKKSFVTIPAGEHRLARTIEVKHDLTVILENGAVLKSSCDPMFRIAGGEFRVEGRGKPGRIVSTSRGVRGWSATKRGAAFDLNHADGGTPLRFFLRNIHVQAYNGADGFWKKPDKHGIETIDISGCIFRCEEKAIAVHSLTLGSARIENCSFDGGDNPIMLDAATPGGMVICGNTLRDFGRCGILAGKAGQVSEGCTAHLPDTIIRDNRLIGGGRGATIRDAYIHGILVYGNHVSVQGNIVRDVNRGEPVPGRRAGRQIRTPDGQILRGKMITVNGKPRRLAGSAIYLKATRALVQGNICSNSGWRSVIEVKTGGKEYYVSVVNNVVDGRSLALDESFGFECHSGRSLWAGNLVYDMPHQAFVVRSGYENTFINNLLADCRIGFALHGKTPGQNELIAGNRFIDVEHPVVLNEKEIVEACGEDILLPPPARIDDRAELPGPGPKWHGRQLIRGDKIYLCIRQNREYRWMEMQGKLLPVRHWELAGPELFFDSDQSGREKSAKSVLNDPRHPGWTLSCMSARERKIPDDELGLARDREVFKTGGSSQKVVFPTTAASWTLSRKIKLTPGRRYRATAVFKAEEPRNIRLSAMPKGSHAAQARGREDADWQTLSVDFTQPLGIADCTIALAGSKTSMGKAAWIDSVSVRELREKARFLGGNQLSDRNVWSPDSAETGLTRLAADSLQLTAGAEKAMMATCKIDLPPGTAWRFAAEIEPRGLCSAVLPDGKKLQSPEYVDFTVPEHAGPVRLRFWTPAQQKGGVATVRNISLRQREP